MKGTVQLAVFRSSFLHHLPVQFANMFFERVKSERMESYG